MADPYTDEQIVTKLLQQRDQLIDLRLKITMKPKPSYNIDGQEVLWADYLETLNKSIEAIGIDIQRFDPPFEEETQMYV